MSRLRMLLLAVSAVLLTVVASACGSVSSPTTSQSSSGIANRPLVAASQSSTESKSESPSYAPNVVDAQRYAGGSTTGQWGFVTPSGNWICALSQSASQHLAACSSNPNQGPLNVPGAPMVPAHGGSAASVPPNAIVIRGAQPGFESFSQTIFSGVPTVLPYAATLQVAGFQCNVAQTGVSCKDEASGGGFTFSDVAYSFRFTPVSSADQATTPPTGTPSRVSDTDATLGKVWGQSQMGYGGVRPATIFNGGDPTGYVSGVVWKSWGGSQATGTGSAIYVAPGQSTADGTRAEATVVAFDLGICDGVLAYRAIEWYFPNKGQQFRPGHYINICTGDYVG